MPPKSFYEINPKTYLFGKSETPEEKVRQWVIFELLSIYGYNINDIQIEVACKIGSKYFPADIVVYQEHRPLIVIECKKVNEENQEEALKQAESYANYLKSTFLVFTNSNLWTVKKSVNGSWLSVADIPSKNLRANSQIISSTLEFVEHIKPLLYWVHQEVPKEKAYRFFQRLLYFVQADVVNYDMSELMKVRLNLLGTLESLICVLGTGGLENAGTLDKDPYTMEKMKETISSFETYLDEIGYKLIFKHKNFDGYRFNELYGMLSSHVNDLVKNQGKITDNNEFLVLRLISALADYLWQIYNEKSYLSISPIVMSEIGKFLNEVSNLALCVSLPDSLDKENYEIMQGYAYDFWK